MGKGVRAKFNEMIGDVQGVLSAGWEIDTAASAMDVGPRVCEGVET